MKPFKKACKPLMLAGIGVSSVIQAPAILAADQVIVEEVVVIARKRAENLQQVPIAVTAFTEKTIEQAGIERPQDFIALTPNVSIVDTANVGDTQVTIRGQVSTRDAEGTFAYVVDGVLQTNPNSFNEELFDVKQIEVLKGPQGALYGRNAVAGAIIVTTKEPSKEAEGSIKIGGGSNNLKKVSGVISGPITDTIGYRAAVSYRDDEGQFSNSFTGKESGTVDYIEDTSFRGRLMWDVNDKLDLDFQMAYSEVEGGAINFNAAFALNEAAPLFGSPKLYEDVNDHDFTYFSNVPGENEQETFSFSAKADYDLGWADLTAVFAYDNLEEYLLSDGTSAAFAVYTATPLCNNNEGPPTGFNYPAPYFVNPDGNGFNDLLPPYSPTSCDGYQYQERNQESTTLEVRLAGEEDGYRWVGGIYLADISREVVVAYGADLGMGFSRKGFVPVGGPDPTDSLFSDDFDTTVLSAFGQMEFDITEKQELALALRWDHEERKVSNNVPNVASPNNPFTATINPYYDVNPTATSIPNRDKTFVQFQPKISWRWQTTEDASVYASYGVGFRSGGFNNSGSAALVESQYGGLQNNAGVFTAPQNLRDDYDKEITKTFEIGVKSEWLDKRLRVNAAIFDTEIEDNQFFNFFAGGFGIQRIITNIDEVSIRGMEIDFQAILSTSWLLYGSYGLIDSEIKENKNRSYTEGNVAPLAPEDTTNLGVQFNQDITSGIEFVARLDWQRTGETWFSTVQNNETANAFTGFGFGMSTFDQAKRDAFDTMSLRLALEAAQWTVTVWGKNITDEDYLEEVIPAPEFGGSFIHQARGDAYGADVVYRF